MSSRGCEGCKGVRLEMGGYVYQTTAIGYNMFFFTPHSQIVFYGIGDKYLKFESVSQCSSNPLLTR